MKNDTKFVEIELYRPQISNYKHSTETIHNPQLSTMSQESDNTQKELPYPYIDPSHRYARAQPHPTLNLIDLYSLTTIANSVARLNQDGTKGVKLRKSYKAHISNLPGKHTDIPNARSISQIVFAPDREGAPIKIEKFEPTMLSYNLDFLKTPETGIPGFDPSNLAIGDVGQGMKRKPKGHGNEEDSKRRRVEW
jgi:mediator of RNA polymerase II transcription subunit 19